MHSQLTCVQNRTNYYEQGSCCISLKLCIATDLITITTVHLVMMVIRTIAVMMRVLFPGSSLPEHVQRVCVCACELVSVCVKEKADTVMRERGLLKIIHLSHFRQK